MDILYSIFFGIGLSLIVSLATIFTAIFGRFTWFFYCALAAYVPYLDFGFQQYYNFIGIIISLYWSLRLYKLTKDYARDKALSAAPKLAAICQGSYFYVLIVSSIISLLF